MSAKQGPKSCVSRDPEKKNCIEELNSKTFPTTPLTPADVEKYQSCRPFLMKKGDQKVNPRKWGLKGL